MADYRVLVVGEPGGAHARDLLACGNIVHEATSSRRLWTGLARGTWDACVIDALLLEGEDPDLVRHAREIQPLLALFVGGEDDAATRELALITGTDDVLSPGRPQIMQRQLSHTITTRRARARSRPATARTKVLVIDWDPVEAPAVCNALIHSDFQVCRASDASTALRTLRSADFEVLLTPTTASVEGASVIEAALRYDPRLRVIVTSDVPDLGDAAVAMSHGAFDYLLRPIGTEQALGAIQNASAAFGNTSPAGETTTRQMSVLVIDSSLGGPRTLEQMLAQEPSLVCSAVRDLPQALRRLRERRFDAVLWNLDTSRGSTIRGVHELRSLTSEPALILIAQRPDAALHDQAMRLGVQDILYRQLLGREAVGARVRMAVLRNQHRMQQNRVIRDLQSREASRQEVVRRSVDAILIVDARGTVVFANPAAERMFAGATHSLLGHRFEYDLDDPAPREIAIHDGALRCIADMTVGDIDWNGFPASLVSLRDVTERQQARELRDRLAHIDRLAAIGQLAAGVTHEINNPATYVMANLTAMNDTLASLALDLADRPDLSARVDELCDMVQENIGGMGRIRSITRDLRTFARIDSNEVTLVDLNECVNAACKIAMSEIRPRAQLIQELGDLPPVPGSQGKLAQVITNLLVNAAQAIPEGQPHEHSIKVRTGATEGAVWCQVQDSGRGIEADVRAKIFDPFFTTKPIGQGTGMGLALCADIVRQHHGTIRALDNPVGGALFEVRLPLVSQLEPSTGRSSNTTPPSSASQTRPRVVTGRPLRLLLIDDEPLVLRSLKRMLARHQVDVAAGGAEALAKLAANSDYDLIFCDLMMPGVDGAAVYAAIVERFPQLLERLVFCSGGAFTPRTKSFLEQSTQPLVEKPMTRESFSDIAQRVLSPSRLRLASGGDA